MKLKNYITLVFAILLVGCTSKLAEPDEQGNSSGTVAKGNVTDPNGKSLTGVALRLVPVSHNPVAGPELGEALKAESQADGSFGFSDVPSGEYNLEAIEDVDDYKALLQGIQIIDSVTADVGHIVMKKTAKLTVSFAGTMLKKGDYLYIPGTTEYTIADSVQAANSIMALPAIPEASYEMIHFFRTGDELVTDLVDDTLSIKSASSDSITVNRDFWRFSQTVQFNTTSTGANVSDTVFGFPVLIRLNNSNFNFSEAQSDGGDIRFTKSDNTILPYEIERYDAIGQTAEIWVKIDTLFGDDDTQTLKMVWGNSNLSGSSNGLAVFDTANGFAGVWHLNETAGLVNDATAFQNHGSRNGTQSQTAGMIGPAQAYRSTKDNTDMGDVLNAGTSSMTVSAWVKFGNSGKVSTIIGKTNGDSQPYKDYGWLMSFENDLFRFMVVADGNRWGDAGAFWMQASEPLEAVETWYFVTAVIDRDDSEACKLYINGVDVTGTRLGDITTVGNAVNTLSMRIGIEADDGYPMTGDIDEAIVSFAPRSESWIKLSYMNQKKVDQLVAFR